MSVMKHFKANEKSLRSDFHMSSSKMAWLCLRQIKITKESTKSENKNSSLNQELHWLWNLVYLIRGFVTYGIYIFKSLD